MELFQWIFGDFTLNQGFSWAVSRCGGTFRLGLLVRPGAHDRKQLNERSAKLTAFVSISILFRRISLRVLWIGAVRNGRHGRAPYGIKRPGMMCMATFSLSGKDVNEIAAAGVDGQSRYGASSQQWRLPIVPIASIGQR